MAKQEIHNPYSVHCFERVEQIIGKERSFRYLLRNYRAYEKRNGRFVSVCDFTRAVVFDLASRSMHGMKCLKIEILRSAYHVREHWPNAPMCEPILTGTTGRQNELLIKLKTALGVLEKKKDDIEKHIEEHKKAIASLMK